MVFCMTSVVLFPSVFHGHRTIEFSRASKGFGPLQPYEPHGVLGTADGAYPAADALPGIDHRPAFILIQGDGLEEAAFHTLAAEDAFLVRPGDEV